MSANPVVVELVEGYRDKKGTVHKRVTIGRRITGRELFSIDDDPQSDLPTQYSALILREKITEFGTLRMPVPLQALLQLDTSEWDAISKAADAFSEESRLIYDESDPEAEPLRRSPSFDPDRSLVKLAFGYEMNGVIYDQVEFGNRIRLSDEVEADRMLLKDIKRRCFLAGKQVSQLSQSEGPLTLPGSLTLLMFNKIDLLDIEAVVAAAEVWRRTFRGAGGVVSGSVG